MSHGDDDREYVCAWGRWRIGPARNEPMAHAPGEAAAEAPPVEHALERPMRLRPRRGRARLRLVGLPAGTGVFR